MIRPHNPNPEFELGGINHVALVCADMARTADFYSGVLGMPLIKSLDLPDGMGQHFVFDAGNGDCAASFYFTDPDGIVLEFACWTKQFGAADTTATPKTSADRTPRHPVAH
jgi:catechol 2,3-dioxygenase-like lactoylglutathione lyase family enzyme